MTSTIQSIPVDPTPPANGDILQYNGTIYTPVAPNPGDITEVNTNLPLTGGGTGGALTLDINNFTGDSGMGGLDGAVPAPAAGDAAAGKFLKADGGWGVPPAAGGMTLLGSGLSGVSTGLVDGDTYAALDTPIAVSAGQNVIAKFLSDVLVADSGIIPAYVEIFITVDGLPNDGGGEPWGRYRIENPGTTLIIFPVFLEAVITGLSVGAHTIRVEIDCPIGKTAFFNNGGGASRLRVFGAS